MLTLEDVVDGGRPLLRFCGVVSSSGAFDEGAFDEGTSLLTCIMNIEKPDVKCGGIA